MSGLVTYRTFLADSERWVRFEHRPGDIVISTPPKAGTTWTQMLCALSVFDGPDFPAQLDALSPWLDMRTRSEDEVFSIYDRQTHQRFIKTHTPLDGLPIRDDVTYVVVGRDPRDVLVSWEHHKANMDYEALMASIAEAGGLDDPAVAAPTPPDPDPAVRFRQFVEEVPSTDLMSLANVLAVSQAARALVLLGDPRQLDQPMQGSHPEGTETSALDHVLEGAQTIQPDQGLFLAETWRLHPDICAFTSEQFYEGKLHSRPGLEQQAVTGGPAIGSGLRFIPVDHIGNHNCSPEEADVIAELVNGILSSGATWTNAEGEEQPIGLAEILIITPYNAQVYEI